MAIVIRYMCCLVFISRSSDLIQYGGIVTKANSSACWQGDRDIHVQKELLQLWPSSNTDCVVVCRMVILF